MQNAKDTFYMALRDRLAALNPARTVLVRGAVRAAVMVAENELLSAEAEPAECFILQWSGTASDVTEPMVLLSARCEVRYCTRGTGELSGMDRGRVLSAMDGELRSMLVPAAIAKRDYTGASPAAMATEVFWSVPVFGAAVSVGDRLSRVATVDVFALQEEGEA